MGGFDASLGSGPHTGWHSRAGSRQEGDSRLATSSAAGPAVYPGPETAGGLPAAVEELSVVDMTDAPVHVLVQNEKSASSLHQAHARVTLAGGLGDGAASPEPPGPAALAAAAAWAGICSSMQRPQDRPQLWYSDSRQAAGWQQPAQQQQFMPVPAQQHGLGLSVAHPSHAAGIVSPASALQQQQQQQAVAHAGVWSAPGGEQHAAATHWVGCAAAPCADRTNVHSHWQPARQKHVMPHAAAAAAPDGGVLHWPPSPVARPPAAGQHHSDWRQQEEQQLWVQQQGVGEAVLGTQEMLLKFDESLVDILAEVERLEQQQQHQARRQQQQGQRQSVVRGGQQQQQQPSSASSGAWPPLRGRPAAGSLSAAGVPVSSQHAQLDLKQAQLQQRIRQLEREGATHSGGHRQPCDTAAWGLTGASAFDADDVADILNQID